MYEVKDVAVFRQLGSGFVVKLMRAIGRECVAGLIT